MGVQMSIILMAGGQGQCSRSCKTVDKYGTIEPEGEDSSEKQEDSAFQQAVVAGDPVTGNAGGAKLQGPAFPLSIPSGSAAGDAACEPVA